MSGNLIKKDKKKSIFFILYLAGAIIAYMLIGRLLGVGFLIDTSGAVSLGAMFVMGLASSLHCVGFCGGIAMYQCSRIRSESCCIPREKNALKPSVQYHAGRIAAYTVIGAILGLVGSIVQLPYTFRGIIILVISAVLILSSVNLLKDYHWLVPKKAGKYADFYHKLARISPALSGVFCAFIPCAPLLTMQAFAFSSGSVVFGALGGLVFGLGTLPLMFGLTTFSTWISARIQKQWKWISGIMILLLGVMLLGRGLAFVGASFSNNIADSAQIRSAITETKAGQTITGNISDKEFPPITAYTGRPIQWVIDLPEGALNANNNLIVIPALGKEYVIHEGKNVLDLPTFEEPRVLVYTNRLGTMGNNIYIIDKAADIK
ncbi:MAG: sulfite exporter TauE/SafE family protein [Christensenellales bacterium]